MLHPSKRTYLFLHDMITVFHNPFSKTLRFACADFLKTLGTLTTVPARIIIVLALGLALASPARAQFTEVTDITDSLTSVSNSSAAWGDYDNDGDLDILLTGSYIANIYRNDGSDTFVDIEAGLTGVSYSSVAWGDYDNDGDLDILLTGTDSATPTYTSIVYRNNGDDTFTDIDAGLPGIYNGSVAWGDYDNDGDLDILLAGSLTGGSAIARLYRNDEGSFTNPLIYFSTDYYTAAAWADFDNDGDLDVFVSGFYKESQLHVNDGGSFAYDGDFDFYVGGAFRDGSVAWGDYDNDGDLDLLSAGINSSGTTRSTWLLKNNGGSSNFTSISAGLEGVEDASMAWGDYDNDGDLDILLSGWTGSSTFARVYQNNGDDTFTDLVAGLPNISNGSGAWGDYDNDGDLDILLTGSGNAKVYENTGEVFNTPPTAPTGLQANVNQDSVQLTWNIGGDTEPDAGGLSYNLRVGTTSGGDELMPAHANSATGYRLIPALGNVQENVSWIVKDLPDGTHYWSVQSIDHAWAGSAFAAEETFVIAVPPAAPQNLAVGNYYDIGTAPLTWDQNTEEDFLRYRIYMDTEPDPTTLVDSTEAIGNTSIAITGLTIGTKYYFRIKAVDAGLLESLDFSNQDSLTVEQYSLKTDSLALVDLYNSTGGTANWTTKWDFGVALPWYRVTVTDGRVAQLKLTGNNLSSAIPSSIGDLSNLTLLWLYDNALTALPTEIGSLTSLTDLRLNGNRLTAIPAEINDLNQLSYLYLYSNQLVDLPDLTALTSTTIRVDYNKLTFEDLIPNINVLNDWIPQDSVGAAQDTTVEAGDSLTLFVTIGGGAANTYQWTKGGQYLTYATDSTLTLDPVAESDAGGYVCIIQNSSTGALRIYSRTQRVTVTNTAAPAAPQNLVAEAGDGQVILTWNKNTESDFLRYRVYSGTAANPTTQVDSTISIIDTTKTLTGLTNDTAYFFRITAVDVALNESAYSSEVSATPTSPSEPSAVSDQDAIPTEYALHQNHPNPFNPATTLRFDLPEAGDVTILVYDLMGREVARLVESRMEPGYHAIVWYGLDEANRQVPTGVYIVRMESTKYTKTIKMLLLK